MLTVTTDVTTVFCPSNLRVMEIQVYACETDILFGGLNPDDAQRGAVAIYPGANTSTAASSVNTVWKLRAARPDAPIVTPIFLSSKTSGGAQIQNCYVVFIGLSEE
jgi:hypothetical protein